MSSDLKSAGYKRLADGIIYNNKFTEVGGVTVSKVGFNFNISNEIYMSPFNSWENFKFAINHEFIHSWQFATVARNMSADEWNRFKEPSAYNYTKIHFPTILNTVHITPYNGIYNLYNWPNLK